MNESNRRYVLLEVEVADPVEGEVKGRFITRLTHPTLTGTLELVHGQEREVLLNAITVDPKTIDPVGSLLNGVREFMANRQ